MENGPRKASDVLLELEKKLDTALGIIRTQDLNIKIMSNKLNAILSVLEKQPAAAGPQKIIVETSHVARPPQVINPPDSERQVFITADNQLPVTNSPQGFRRTSRPETFSGDNAYLNDPSTAVAPKFPTQIPKAPHGREAEVMVPPQSNRPAAPQKAKQTVTETPGNVVPVTQRVVNSQGKSLFLADVEVIDLTTMNKVCATRTNGTGKWTAPLPMGNYRISIRKVELSTKEKMEATQDIVVDGATSPLTLQTVIMK